MNRYINMSWELAKREIRNKYAGSYFGWLWSIIIPISYIIIYTTVFSKLMSAKLPEMTGLFDYSVYLSAGILGWTVFNDTVIRLQNIFLENSNLIRKVYFPKLSLIVSVIISSLIDLFINYSLLFVVLLVINYHENYTYLFVFIVALLQQLFALGLGLVLSVLCVHFKDLNQIIKITFQLWFWFTPIVYAQQILPDLYIRIIKWNPFYYFIKNYQDILLYNQVQWELFGIIFLISLMTLLLGAIIYKKYNGSISDLI